ESPSWKCSYRLISNMFEDEKEFFLQNYALVDNGMDEDWIAVDLTLISGLPISFVYDLYSPNWVTRFFKRPEKSYGLSAVEFKESKQEVGLLPEAVEEERGIERKSKRKYGRKLSFTRGHALLPSTIPPAQPSIPITMAMKKPAMDKMKKKQKQEIAREEEFIVFKGEMEFDDEYKFEPSKILRN
ncbi:MAG: hypothetical protein ACTSO9_18430, partial [Candidatus Helarchaeota archaeon]